MKEKIFILGLALLATHELDAMIHKEWELLMPFLESKTGEVVFILLHILIFFASHHYISHPNEPIRYRFKTLMSWFLLLHGLAHFVFSLFHEGYSFSPPIVSITVYGGSLCG